MDINNLYGYNLSFQDANIQLFSHFATNNLQHFYSGGYISDILHITFLSYAIFDCFFNSIEDAAPYGTCVKHHTRQSRSVVPSCRGRCLSKRGNMVPSPPCCRIFPTGSLPVFYRTTLRLQLVWCYVQLASRSVSPTRQPR